MPKVSEIKWKDIGLEIGKNRKLWYKNTMKYIQTISVKNQLLQKELNINPFEYLVELSCPKDNLKL